MVGVQPEILFLEIVTTLDSNENFIGSTPDVYAADASRDKTNCKVFPQSNLSGVYI